MLHPEDIPYVSDPRYELDYEPVGGLTDTELSEAQDWFDELIHHVYVTGNLDHFENALEELSGRLDIKLPAHPPKLRGIE